MTTHDLKCWSSEYDATVRGDKPFEVRATHDRDFSVGDVLVLWKWDPNTRGYVYPERVGMGDSVHSRWLVTYVLHGGRFGLPPGLCVLGIKPETPDLESA
jgi:hypothetical protein